MAQYRGPLGLVDAAEFVAGEDIDLLVYGEDRDPDWPQQAFNAKLLERGAIGQVPSLIVNFRGASYGLAKGDWVLRTAAGDIVPCVRTRFESDYERVYG